MDGWALTMLSRENVGYASTCNSVGQTAGYFLGNVLFLALESADFCNKYLRIEPKETGIITLSGIFYPPANIRQAMLMRIVSHMGEVICC